MSGPGAAPGGSAPGFPQGLLQVRTYDISSRGEITPEQVQTIRRMVAENPTLTGPLIESLKQTDPERAANLTPSDPDGILRFFSELRDDDTA